MWELLTQGVYVEDHYKIGGIPKVKYGFPKMLLE